MSIEHDVALVRLRERPRPREDVAALADRPDDLGRAGLGRAEAGEVDDVVVRPVERRAEERVHPGVEADVADGALPLDLRHARQEHAGLGHEEPAGLDPDAEVGVPIGRRSQRGTGLAERGAGRGEVVRRRAAGRDGDPAADVEVADLGEVLPREPAEEPGVLGPHAEVVVPAAGVGVEPDDADAEPAGGLGQRREVGRRDAELRGVAGGLDVVVVPLPLAGVDADRDGVAGPDLGPGVERRRVVDGRVDAERERAGDLGAPGEVGRVEDPLGREARHGLQHVLDLEHGDALEVEPLVDERAENLRVVVRLDGVEDAVDGDGRAEVAGPLADRAEVVDVARRAVGGEGEERVAAGAPPGRRGHESGGGSPGKVRRSARGRRRKSEAAGYLPPMICPAPARDLAAGPARPSQAGRLGGGGAR